MMKKIIPLCLITVVVFLYTRPFFHSGFIATHDGEWSIVRLAEMYREIKDGQFPPRWSDYLNHGFGYPLFLFTYPMPFYSGVILKLAGFGFISSIKILFVISVLISGLAMFELGKELIDDYAGALSSIFYITVPYRLVDLYVRGSIGESLSFALLPLIFLLALRFIRRPTSFSFSLLCLALASLVLTHNVTAILFFPVFLGFFMAISFVQKKRKLILSIKNLLLTILLSLGLCAYFFIPALIEKKYLLLETIKLADVSENFIQISDYLNSPWSYGSKPSVRLGGTLIISSLISLSLGFVLGKKVKNKFFPLLLLILISVGLIVFFSNSASKIFWQFPPLSWIDFPWRLTLILAFLLSFSTIFLALNKYTKTIGIILALLSILGNLNFVKPSGYIDKEDTYYLTNDATTTSKDELMPLWVVNKPKNRFQKKVEVLEESAQVRNLQYSSNQIKFQLDLFSDSLVKINTVYFPGWQITAKSKIIPISYLNSNGTIQFWLNSGTYTIRGNFTKTPIRYYSDLISITCLSFLALINIVSLKHKKIFL